MAGPSISPVSGAIVPVIPFRQFVLKVYSRCNLACNYCYVYEMNDESWRTQPYRMSTATIRLTIKRIADHVRAHGLETVAIVLHGGEPLLAGAAFLAELASLMRSEIPAEVEVSLQTNGLLLNADALSTLTRQAIRIGVSLDGGARANDRHRLFPNARSSHSDVDRALRVLGHKRYRPFYAGLLCTIDLANDPVATYEALLAYTPPALDFLLLHGTLFRSTAGYRRHGNRSTVRRMAARRVRQVVFRTGDIGTALPRDSPARARRRRRPRRAGTAPGYLHRG